MFHADYTICSLCVSGEPEAPDKLFVVVCADDTICSLNLRRALYRLACGTIVRPTSPHCACMCTHSHFFVGASPFQAKPLCEH
jgi:hypothetical protein